MPGYPRYRFDQSFGGAALAVEPELVEEPDPLDLPRHSERDHQAALAMARDDGLAAGLAQGRREGETQAYRRIEADLVAALDGLAGQLAVLESSHTALMERLEAQGACVLVALVRRIAPRLLDSVARAEIERLASDALRAAGQAPVLRLRVHPSLRGPLERRLAGQADFAGRLEILDDPALDTGALEASWGAGSVGRDPAALEATLTELTERTLAALQPAAGSAAPS
ncbi:flagellar assembly protein FliH [Azospirillum sp. TSO35-2]|uniref:flagellar assembly protein FliH n=1 Tax=Azospirillum sp. TSO35-2 TaxID=716796 RepID=UPI000D60A9D6|nr:flagellar assembly protein FliH [Azospirillum sp. TSO35-2]PWC37809.1 flagellar assembly protein FliH [Azospirillum sp. TSO35-2]